MAPASESGEKGKASSSVGARISSTSAGKWIGGLAICALVAAGAWWWSRHHQSSADGKASGPGRGGQPPVPVVAGVVAEKDVPVFLDGLGTVQAFNTVTIRARVDGQVVKVAFKEGQDVHEGDVLVEIDPAPYRAALEQALAKKGQDEALLANARADLRRYEDLLANEGVTRQVYDTQKATVNQLEAGIKADQAAIESAQVQLGYTTIVSPIEGRTGLRLVDKGNMVRANDAAGLVVITQLKPVSVVFTLPAQNLAVIQQHAHNAELTVLAMGRDNTNVLGEGKLAVIDNQIDTATDNIKLKATFPNADLRLWPGQFVNPRLLLTIRKNSAVVPESAVQRGPEGAFAFVIKEDQTVETREVTVGQIERGEALIEEGLRPGDRVVVDGQYKLQKGSRIKPVEAASPAGGGDRGRRAPGAPGPGDASGGQGTSRPRS